MGASETTRKHIGSFAPCRLKSELTRCGSIGQGFWFSYHPRFSPPRRLAIVVAAPHFAGARHPLVGNHSKAARQPSSSNHQDASQSKRAFPHHVIPALVLPNHALAQLTGHQISIYFIASADTFVSERQVLTGGRLKWGDSDLVHQYKPELQSAARAKL